MKIAIFSESPADEAAIAILIEAVMGKPLERVDHKLLRKPRGGVTHVLNILPAVINSLYYQSDAEGLVVVVDSNGDPYHQNSHLPDKESDCRWCRMHHIANQAISKLSRRPIDKTLNVAFGLTSNCFESWLLFKGDPGYHEANRIPPNKRLPSDRIQMKKKVYGTDRPSLELETRVMTEKAREIAKDIERFEKAFPIGFGVLSRELRKWAADRG